MARYSDKLPALTRLAHLHATRDICDTAVMYGGRPETQLVGEFGRFTFKSVNDARYFRDRLPKYAVGVRDDTLVIVKPKRS